MKRCGSCDSWHETEYKCCEKCRKKWRDDKPSKRSFNKKLLDEVISDLAGLPNLGKIVTKITIVRDGL